MGTPGGAPACSPDSGKPYRLQFQAPGRNHQGLIDRYFCRPDREGRGWAVYDRVTGKLVELQGAFQRGLSEEEADDIVSFLNRAEKKVAPPMSS